MSDFTEFTQAFKRHQIADKKFAKASRDLHKARGNLDQFVQESYHELKTITDEFTKSGLLPVEADFTRNINFTTQGTSFGIETIRFRAIDYEKPTSERHAHVGRIVADIIRAAKKNNVQIVELPRCDRPTDTIGISKGVSKVDGTAVLIDALGAYAKEKGNHELANLATDAADRVRNLAKSFSSPKEQVRI